MFHARQTVILAGLLLSVTTVRAAFERLPGGARHAAMGGLYPAADALVSVLAGTDRRLAGFQGYVFAAPRLYGCDHLSFGGVEAAFPALNGLLTLGGTRFGCPGYRELTVSLGCVLPAADGFDAGCALHMCHLSIAGYGAATTVGIDVALAVSLGKSVTYYGAALNVNAPTIGAARNRLPQSLVSGLIIAPAGGVSVTVEAEKELSRDVEFRAGAQCTLATDVVLFAGMSPATSAYGGGCSIGYGPVAIEYGLTGHTELGVTHWFAVRWHGE